jgi:hypothetical protein
MGGQRRFSARLAGVAIIAGSALLAVPSIGMQPAGAATSKNLIKNGTAEKGTGGTGAVVPVPGWTQTTGSTFTAVTYTAGGGFPDGTSPGPTNRGLNFFAGGPGDATAIAEQTVRLKPYATAIAGGGVTFDLTGYLGGFSTQNDQASVEIQFKDRHGVTLQSDTIGPVDATNRGGLTGLLLRGANGSVPVDAKTVLVRLVLVRTDGTYNDGYADNLSLKLSGV